LHDGYNKNAVKSYSPDRFADTKVIHGLASRLRFYWLLGIRGADCVVVRC
jgi:hypothetical protein